VGFEPAKGWSKKSIHMKNHLQQNTLTCGKFPNKNSASFSFCLKSQLSVLQIWNKCSWTSCYCTLLFLQNFISDSCLIIQILKVVYCFTASYFKLLVEKATYIYFNEL
jgi:hypothetical protein